MNHKSKRTGGIPKLGLTQNNPELEQMIQKYDPAGFISNAMGLSWNKNEIRVFHRDGNADFKDDDKIFVDYRRAPQWLILGIVHELVHLILRQNDWLKNAVIAEFVATHPEFSPRESGYAIEQLIAYLIQADFAAVVAKGENLPEVAKEWGPAKFKKIISAEYQGDIKESFARAIIEKWPKRNPQKSIIAWIGTITPMLSMENYAYIDGANLYSSLQALGWQLDYERFRIWLSDKYKIKRAYIFLGLIPKYNDLYTFLQKAGFTLVFKEVIYDNTGKAKGNCDADLVLQAARDAYENKFNRAILVSSDGDYASLVKFLIQKNKMMALLSPAKTEKCSILLKRTGVKIAYLDDQRSLLELLNKEKAPGGDELRKGLFRRNA